MENLPVMNIFDLAVIGLLLLCLVQGIIRGLSGELARFIGWVVVIVAGIYTYSDIGRFVYQHSRLDSDEALAVAFLLVIFGGLIVMTILRVLLKNVLSTLFKGGFNRIGGALVGLLRAAVMTIMVVFLVNLWPHPYINRVVMKESFFGRLIATHLEDPTPDWVHEQIRQVYPVHEEDE